MEELKQAQQAIAQLKIRCFDLSEANAQLEAGIQSSNNAVVRLAEAAGMEVEDNRIDVDALVELVKFSNQQEED